MYENIIQLNQIKIKNIALSTDEIKYKSVKSKIKINKEKFNGIK